MIRPGRGAEGGAGCTARPAGASGWLDSAGARAGARWGSGRGESGRGASVRWGARGATLVGGADGRASGAVGTGRTGGAGRCGSGRATGGGARLGAGPRLGAGLWAGAARGTGRGAGAISAGGAGRAGGARRCGGSARAGGAAAGGAAGGAAEGGSWRAGGAASPPGRLAGARRSGSAGSVTCARRRAALSVSPAAWASVPAWEYPMRGPTDDKRTVIKRTGLYALRVTNGILRSVHGEKSPKEKRQNARIVPAAGFAVIRRIRP